MADPVKHILWTVRAMIPEIIEEQKRDPQVHLLAHIIQRVQNEIVKILKENYNEKEVCAILGVSKVPEAERIV